jgi:tellurite resistance protein TerC
MKVAIKHIRKIMITVAGVTVILLGVALLVLPGPGIIIIIIGLAILATEYEIAKIWLSKAKQKYDDGKKFVTRKK